jgi:hypothetical protein
MMNSSRRTTILIFLLIAVVSCEPIRISIGHYNIENTKARIVQDIPLGTSFGEVQDYMLRNKIESDWDSKSSTYGAIFRHMYSGILIPVDISLQITLHLNQNRKVDKITFDEVSTSVF